MKICYVAPACIHTYRWMKYFADRGHEVHLITTIDKGFEIDKSAIGSTQVHLLRKMWANNKLMNYALESIPVMMQYNRIIREIEPDIIHAHFIMESTALLAKSGFHPFVLTPWGSDVLILPKQSITQRAIVKYVLNKADLITTDGEHVKEHLITHGVNPDKIKLIYFGTDTKMFQPNKRDEKLRERYPIIISTRSLEPLYDVKTLLYAMKIVLQQYNNAELWIAGDGSEKEYLGMTVESIGIGSHTRFLGHLNQEELSRYVASSDIYVSTSLSDAGLSGCTAEAMASGLPVIVTEFGDNGKWIKNGANGFVIPPKTPKALAENILYLISKPEECKQMGITNRSIICLSNNYELEMAKMGLIYQTLVTK